MEIELGKDESGVIGAVGCKYCRYIHIPVVGLGRGLGRVAVPSGYAGFTRISCLGGTGGAGVVWMYGPTAATLEGTVG